jgi:uncharacterized protein with HEPN domain
MRSKLGDKARLEHILQAITEIESYTKDLNLDNFLDNTLYQSAITRQIEIIGEAANKLSDDINKTTKKSNGGELPDSEIF